jgi:YcaO-like protein with predicted kinase domain
VTTLITGAGDSGDASVGGRGVSGLEGILDRASTEAKRFRAGTHRVVSPGETVERVRELMPAMGITRIANVTGLDSIGIPVVMVCRPNSRSLAVAQGKGIDLPSAQASGLMESVEFYHAEYVDLPLKFASYEEMRESYPTIDVSGLPRLPENVFRPSAPLLWVEGYDLLSQSSKWLPYDAVHTNFTVDVPDVVRTFIPSSNGLASGNTLAEAASQALAEVVERDSATLFTLSGRPYQDRRRVDLATVDDPLCRELLATFERAAIDVGIWDMTSDAGFPTFRAFITERRPNPLHPLPNAGGFGCHPSRSVALMRAATEAAQSRLTFISGARDDMFRDMYEHAFNPGAIAAGRAWVSEPCPHDFHDVPTFEGDSFQDDITWELDRLRAISAKEAVVVDLTKPQIGLPVVKVVVPGLEFVDSSIHRGSQYQHGERARRVVERREMEEAASTVRFFAVPQPAPASSEADVPVLGPRIGTPPETRVAGPEGVTLLLREVVESGQRPEIAIFMGPSLSASEARPYLDALYMPPVSEGDVYRAALLRPRAIGIIDGYFEQVPAVWHKEILWAMSQGIHVFGAASMGALRAAELHAFGMEGVGEIFRHFRDGDLEDDDEVAVLHAPAEAGYEALSEAMVDIRATLRAAVRAGIIGPEAQAALESAAKRLPYPQRTFQRILAGAAGADVERLRNWLPENRVQQKRADAVALLQTLGDWIACDPGPKTVPWAFQQTYLWHTAQERAGQFISEDLGVGALRTDVLLEELRVDADTYTSVLEDAMLRLLAGREAARRGVTPDREAIGGAVRDWQMERGLRSPAEVEAWLVREELTPERLAEALRPQAALRSILPLIQGDLIPHMLDVLRLDGNYSRLLARSRHKQEVLSAMGLDNPATSQSGAAESQALAWYFKERLRTAVPADLESYARYLGYVERRDLVRAVLREYWYLQYSGQPA